MKTSSVSGKRGVSKVIAALPNIGILGPIGSGKGTAARYLTKKYKYKIINMGNIVRAIARKEHIKPIRKNLEKLQIKYSKKYGKDFVIGKAIEKANLSRKPVILDGIRKPIQARLAKQKLKAKLILVDASPEIRFKRLKKRRRAGFSKTFQEFKKIDSAENKIFAFSKTKKYADYFIYNDKGERYLYKELSLLMKKLKKS